MGIMTLWHVGIRTHPWMVGSHRAALGLCVLLLALGGCAQAPPAAPTPTPPGVVDANASMVFGRIRLIENDQETTWGGHFDRPTPELYHVEADRFVNRISLAGGLFKEAFEQDGSFCWTLPPGTYLISRIVPWQGNVTKADDTRKNIFPGIAFKVPEGSEAVYLGTLKISISARKDFMGNKWMTGRPSIQVLDEFERDQGIPRERYAGFSGRVGKQLMLWNRDLEMVHLYPTSRFLPILNSLPWSLLIYR